MKISAQILVFLFLIVSIFFIFSPKAHAAKQANTPTAYSDSSAVLNVEENVPKNIHSGAQVVMIEVISAMVCQLVGYDPISSNHKCLGVNPETGKIGFVENGGGMIGVMGNLIDATFTPPASSTQYVAYMQSKFGIVKPTYAQAAENPCVSTGANTYSRGFGFCGLQPVLGLWVAMRNIVYLILILVFVVIGLGIMLRIHIDPRTVMTIQNQIPKIIVGIVAITFSFAIAGLLIDVMYVAMYLFAAVITSATSPTATINTNIVLAANPFDAANVAFNNADGVDGGILGVAGQASSAFSEIVKSIFDSQTTNFGGNIVMDILAGVVGVIVNVIGFLIIAIAIVVALVRLWVSLVITYINIILDVVFAPFWILAGMLPGSSMGVGAWLRDLIANLAVFPVAISFFLLANVFISAFVDGSNRFVPPLVGGVNPQATAAIIGMGFILMLPNVMSTVKAALKAPKINFGQIMGPVSAGAGALTSTPKRLTDLGGRAYYAHQGEGKWNKFGRFFGNPYYFGGGHGKPHS